MSSTQWFHVSTKHNPADCASRGLLPSSLVYNELWFTGPCFLKNKVIEYNRPKDLKINLEETIKVHTNLVVSENPIFDKYSSLGKLLRVVAYCRRFLRRDNHNSTY